MNNIALIGRVGRDPEIKTISTNGGDKLIAETSLAVYRPAKEKDKQTVWFNIKAFGASAERLEQYVKKGHQLGITGRMDCEKFTTKDGVDKERWVVIVDHVDLIKNSGASEQPAASRQQLINDEEIPF